MTRTKLNTFVKGVAELNHGTEQKMRRMQAELNNIVRQQLAGAKLNSTGSARRWAELNNTVRKKRAGAKLKNAA